MSDMTIYLKTVDGFGILFDAEEEDHSMREYFIKECGWTESEYREIENCAWFVAKVTAWKDGIELAAEYLGCCCYTTVEEFYTKYKDDCLADMIDEVVAQAKIKEAKSHDHDNPRLSS